ncbi:MAG: 2-oxo acid dehydrogenase subunit E2 [Oscillospiraceae bacterium]|jgi:pyruvate dehydrogenase E2 component (dihydrolipoamide acetyltransferase)|nr:2-oxo acid dehydrogenase subunit E2 [Oscillospiraceae bacterium]
MPDHKKIRSVEHFGLQRKIVANMTTESWETIPHAGTNYEPDVTDFWEMYQQLRKTDPKWSRVTANTLMLYVVTQGILAAPVMNGHIYFRRKSANGRIEQHESINISVPMSLPVGGMMTINIHNCERMSLWQISDYIEDVRRRMENTDFETAMFEAAFENTIRLLKKGRVDIIAQRLLGNAFGKGKMSRLSGQARKDYFAIPATDRLTKRDIEQGSITVSNLGSVYRGSYAPPALLEIIPPQICVVGLGSVTERPGVVTAGDGAKEVVPRKFIPISLLFDHRALDYGDIVPFMQRLDHIFAHPEELKDWK